MVFTHMLNESCWCGYFYFTHLLHNWFIKRVGRIIPLLGYSLYLFDVIRSVSWILFIQGVLRRLPWFNTDKLVPFEMTEIQLEKLTVLGNIGINMTPCIKILLNVILLYSEQILLSPWVRL